MTQEKMTNEEFIMLLRRVRVFVFWFTTGGWMYLVFRLLLHSNATTSDWCVFTAYIVAGCFATVTGTILDFSLENLRQELKKHDRV
jgi:hypothetical protein